MVDPQVASLLDRRFGVQRHAHASASQHAKIIGPVANGKSNGSNGAEDKNCFELKETTNRKPKLERTTTVMTTVSVGAPTTSSDEIPQVVIETSSLSRVNEETESKKSSVTIKTNGACTNGVSAHSDEGSGVAS